MKTLKEIRVELIIKAKQEYEEFLNEISKLPPKEIISKSYEIVTKEEFLILLENDKSYSIKTLLVLNSFNYPLSTIYSEWLSNDYSIVDLLEETVSELIEKEEKDIENMANELVGDIEDDEMDR